MREEAAQMGTYLNPGNLGFKEIIAGEYVDKTGLISLINRTIGTKQKLTCISRPRRFGKSYAAQMLSAYYGKNCDSAALFKDYEISGDPSYLKHLNRYDVIYVDMTYLKPFTDGYRTLASYLTAKLTEELKAEYPSLEVSNELPATMISAAELTGNRFVMIIDEWDAPIREEPAIEKEYLEFLRTLFKGCQTVPRIFAAVYMTGILPIKKDGSQSAISDFEEYTMLDPAEFARYVGLTEPEVKRICRGFHADFDKMKLWYDGYHLEGVGSVYNPNSVIKAARSNTFRSYWTQTSAAESLMGYLGRDEKGLGKTIAELIGGIEVEVDTNGFANDLITFRDKDDVLTLLVHLGYLAYDEERQTVSIPNEEIRLEFTKAVRKVKNSDTMQRVCESDQLIYDTVHQNADAVAAAIERIHREETSPLHYNREDSLRSVIKLAYFSYKDQYIKMEELPSGNGYADIVYLPKPRSAYPALIVELKWNRSAKGAIDQIKARHYPDILKDIGSDILLVGINYDKDAPAGERKHSCIIEKI